MTSVHDAVPWDVGQLCTPPEESRVLFERLYDPDSGRLRFDRTGEFWDGVAVAREQGRRGQGRRIAILDSGFDTMLLPASAVLAPDSFVTPATVERRGNHGTLVALLAHEIAPEAELVLLEVAPGAHLRSEAVAKALTRASEPGLDVLNLSMEFPTDCRVRDRSAMDIEVLVSADPPLDAYVKQVEAWLELSEPYEPGGCRRACPLCAALRPLPPDTLVVAATGNTDRTACPACLERCLGLGFTHRTEVERESADVVHHGLPQGFDQSLYTELLIPQPKELLGTSFAAPLIAGFSALVEDRDELAAMARLPFATYPLFLLLETLTQRGGPGPGWITLQHGFVTYAGALPPGHQHWREAAPGPCATCSLIMADWYMTYVAMLMFIDRPDVAARWGAVAAAVLSRSSRAAGNLGEAIARLAEREPEGSPDRRRLQKEAAGHFARALELRPGEEAWEARLAQLAAESGH